MKKLEQKYLVFERVGITKTSVGVFKNINDVIRFINKEYQVNTKAENLKEVLDTNFGEAWLYLDFYEIIVELGE